MQAPGARDRLTKRSRTQRLSSRRILAPGRKAASGVPPSPAVQIAARSLEVGPGTITASGPWKSFRLTTAAEGV